MCTWIHESDAELICMRFFSFFFFFFFFFILRCFNILCYASGFYMLLFFLQMFLTRARARAHVCVCVCVCVVHWHCTAQLSMFNMEKRFRNKIIIIIILTVLACWTVLFTHVLQLPVPVLCFMMVGVHTAHYSSREINGMASPAVSDGDAGLLGSSVSLAHSDLYCLLVGCLTSEQHASVS